MKGKIKTRILQRFLLFAVLISLFVPPVFTIDIQTAQKDQAVASSQTPTQTPSNAQTPDPTGAFSFIDTVTGMAASSTYSASLSGDLNTITIDSPAYLQVRSAYQITGQELATPKSVLDKANEKGMNIVAVTNGAFFGYSSLEGKNIGSTNVGATCLYIEDGKQYFPYEYPDDDPKNNEFSCKNRYEFYITKNNEAGILPYPEFENKYKAGGYADIKYALQGVNILHDNGVVTDYPTDIEFTFHSGKKERNGVCITNDNKIILFVHTSKIGLIDLAKKLKDELNCKHAINTDGGATSSMYVKDKNYYFKSFTDDTAQNSICSNIKSINDFIKRKDGRTQGHGCAFNFFLVSSSTAGMPAVAGAPSFDPNSFIGQNCVPGSVMPTLLSGDGLAYESYDYHNGIFHAITIDPSKFDVKLVSAKKATGKSTATLAEIVRNTPGAVAGINAGFFKSGGSPAHTVVEDGVMDKSGTGEYTFLLEKGNHNVIRASEFASYSSDTIKGSVDSSISSYGLMFNGGTVPCRSKASFCKGGHPRSGVCITRDGTVKLLATNGVPKGSSLVGGKVSVDTFAQEGINKHGCVAGLNLDGGGSTSIEYHFNGQDVSLKGERGASGCKGRGFPCQRRVGNALVVVPKQIKPQAVASSQPAAQTPGSAQTSGPTGAFSLIDTITGFAASENCPDFSKIENANKRDFFGNYWGHAITASNGAVELAKFTLAQAALESGWGKSSLTKEANNFFGVKGAGDAGSVTKRTREVYGGRETYVNAKFAKYSTPAESFKAHNDLLEKSRYVKKRQQLFGTSDTTKLTADQVLEATWKAGYATDPKYIQLVTPIIRELEKAVSCLGITAPVGPTPTTPNQQIGCMCQLTTQNTMVTVSPSTSTKTITNIPISGAAASDKPVTYDFSQIESATKGYGAKKDLSRIAKFENHIQEASQKFNVPAEFIKGIIMVGSNGKTYPIKDGKGPCDSSGYCLCNPAGYCGLMQTGHMDSKCNPSYGCSWESFQKGDGGAKDQIFSGANLINVIMKDLGIGDKGSPDYFYWVALAYNTGPTYAKNIRGFAAQRLGVAKEKVQWKDVTKDDTRMNQMRVWPSLPGKTEETYYYPHKVMSVVEAVSSSQGAPQMIQQTEGMQCSYGYEYDYVSIGKYYINPSFTAEVDYNINHYNLITNEVKNMIAGCSGKDYGSLRSCVKNAVKDAGYIDGGNVKLYNGPCDYAENMFSDFVEWTDACAKSSGTDCVCEIPLEYEYQKDDTDEEIMITASGNTITSGNPGIAQQTISGSVSGTKEIKTKTSAEVHYAKKVGNTLTFTDSSSGTECNLNKRTYKFCAETKKLYMVYDENEKKLALKPIQYKFSIDFSEAQQPQPGVT